MTAELPAALAPWAPWLADLVPELHGAFGDTVTALERMVGPLPPLPDPGAIEPSGLDGLARTGPYERLLLSEWVLADEVPEEFLRRAAAREHLFHQLARESPQRGRRCLVLVDTGPEQLGGPRLAQLALLVVFARRAARAKAAFAWASLQHPRAFDEGAFRAFPELRSARVASTDDVGLALAALGEPAPEDEVFFVGGAAVERLARARPWVRVDETLDDGPDRLRITVRRPGLAPVSRELPLPAPEVRTRWLRDPFRAPTAAPLPPRTARPPRRVAGGHAALTPFLRFSADGNRILAVDVDGTVLGFRLPQGGEPLRGPVRIEPPTTGARPVAVGWSSGRLQALFVPPGDTGREPIWRGGRAWWETWTAGTPEVGDAPGEVLTWKEGGAMAAWFLLGKTLHEWRTGAGFSVRSTDCLAIGRRDGARFLVQRPLDGSTEVVWERAGEPPSAVHAAPPAERVVVGSAAARGVGQVVLESTDRWTPLTHGDAAVPRPPGARLAGAPEGWETLRGRSELRRGLVWLQGTELRFRWVWPTPGEEQVVTRSALAAAGGTLHYSRQVAWIEAPSTVVVWDLGGGEVVRWSSS